MRDTLILSLALSMALASACSNGPGGSPDAGMITLSDAGGADGGGACAAPTSGFGTEEGSNLFPLTLDRCDGTPFDIYSEADGFCDARFTILAMAAGWCQPCRIEAAQMEALLVQAYADQHVRVVVALIQDNGSGAPDGAFCNEWVSQYGLTNPVLIDPVQDTQIYFPAGSLPATLIIDSRGVIRHREYGVSTGLETTRAALDQLLAQP
ncbi:MAG: TlpA family protein disulfide reductase [Sandaracinaceae bacterium]|nr:TlpA family protein disulfide reductase [Sandaracinaceae bacterium]